MPDGFKPLKLPNSRCPRIRELLCLLAFAGSWVTLSTTVKSIKYVVCSAATTARSAGCQTQSFPPTTLAMRALPRIQLVIDNTQLVGFVS